MTEWVGDAPCVSPVDPVKNFLYRIHNEDLQYHFLISAGGHWKC
jgi:hypothetical protein